MKKDNTSPKVMGIDPAAGKPNAYCVFQGDRVLEYGMIRDYEHYQELLLEFQPRLVAIEGQYLDMNPKSFAQLVAERAILEYIASSLDFETLIVSPKSWQSAIQINIKTKRNSKERTRWIINVARSLVPKCGFDVKMNIDEAAAVHIAAWASRNFKTKKIKEAK